LAQAVAFPRPWRQERLTVLRRQWRVPVKLLQVQVWWVWPRAPLDWLHQVAAVRLAVASWVRPPVEEVEGRR